MGRLEMMLTEQLEYVFRNGIALRTEFIGMDTDARYFNVGLLKRFGQVPVVVPPVLKPPTVVTPVPKAPQPAEPKGPVMFRPVVAPFIYFEFDKSDLSTESLAKLDSFAEALKDKDLKLQVEGHTDWIAPEAYNVSLSIRRAEAVANHLVSRGIDASRIITMGYGESRPVSNNNTAEGRRLNRRSEMIIK